MTTTFQHCVYLVFSYLSFYFFQRTHNLTFTLTGIFLSSCKCYKKTLKFLYCLNSPKKLISIRAYCNLHMSNFILTTFVKLFKLLFSLIKIKFSMNKYLTITILMDFVYICHTHHKIHPRQI